MAVEIEHKYLVINKSYRDLAEEQIEIQQGYLSVNPERTVRIRLFGNTGFITVKGKTERSTRLEFEYEIPASDACTMLGLCIQPILEKRRYIVNWNGKKWEVDEFGGELSPLVIAEIELEDKEEKYELPPFVGKNVSGDPQYYNSNLCKVLSHVP